MQARIRKEKASGNWQTVGGGALAPLWSPQKEGEAVVVRLLELRKMGSFGKRQSWGIVCRAVELQSDSFFAGKGKQRKRIPVKAGENIALPLSAALVQSNLASIGEGKKAQPQWGTLGEAARKHDVALRVVYQGEVPIGGGQRVKRMLVQAPADLAAKLHL